MSYAGSNVTDIWHSSFAVHVNQRTCLVAISATRPGAGRASYCSTRRNPLRRKSFRFSTLPPAQASYATCGARNLFRIHLAQNTGVVPFGPPRGPKWNNKYLTPAPSTKSKIPNPRNTRRPITIGLDIPSDVARRAREARRAQDRICPLQMHGRPRLPHRFPQFGLFQFLGFALSTTVPPR